MLRPDGYCREVRAGHRLSLSDRTIDAAQTRSGQGIVFALPVEAARPVFSGRQIKSSIKSLCRRCGSLARAVLDAIFVRPTLHEPSPAGSGASHGRRSRRDDSCLDQATKRAGANREITLRFLAAPGPTRPTPVRVRRTGTTLPRTRTTTSGCGLPVTHILRSVAATARQAGHFSVVSRFCPPSGNTLRGLAERRVLQYGKARPA